MTHNAVPKSFNIIVAAAALSFSFAAMQPALALNPKKKPEQTTFPPSDPISRSSIYLNRGQPREALAVMDESIKKGDRRWQAYFQRGMIYKSMRRADEALADMDECLRFAPDELSPLVQHADIDASIMEDERAIEYLNRAMKLEGGWGCLVQRSSCYQNIGNYKVAAADLEMYISGHPERETADVYRNLGHALCLSQNQAKGIEYLSRALALNPKIAKAHTWRAEAYMQLKNYKAAAEDLTVSLKVLQDPEAYAKRIQCYELMGRSDLVAKDKAALHNLSADAFEIAPFRTVAGDSQRLKKSDDSARKAK